MVAPRRVKRDGIEGRPLGVSPVRSGRRANPETPAKIEARRRAVAPLFAYMRRYHFIPVRVVRDACALSGVEPISHARIYHIERGTCFTPEWFVESCCRAMGRPVEEVMGPSHGGNGGNGGSGGDSGPAGRAA